LAELHVTNGDVAAEAIRARLNVPRATLLPWRDVLHEGPVPAGQDDAALRHTRAAFLAAQGWADADEARIDFAARDAALAEAVDLATRVTLWFEDDLYDQLQLIQVLDRLREHKGPIALVNLPRKLVDLAFVYGAARPLGERQIELAVAAWAAFRAPTPQALHELVLTRTPALPDLGPALRRQLEQLPATTDGLARTERQTLQVIAAGAVTRSEIFLDATALDDPPFMGDAPFWAWLDGLAAGADPLIAVDAATQTYGLTDAGRSCLAGGADRVALTGGVDRWQGGVHIEGREPAWRWDPHAAAPRGGPNGP
jgi:hypothetical protein